jgi:hypothetical protein
MILDLTSVYTLIMEYIHKTTFTLTLLLSKIAERMSTKVVKIICYNIPGEDIKWYVSRDTTTKQQDHIL